jgi:benzodiazapine receptor
LAVRALDRSPSAVVRVAANRALVLYFAQLGLNMLWTPLFFGTPEDLLAQ